MKDYEVELRALVPADQVERILEYCKRRGKLISRDRRFFIAYDDPDGSGPRSRQRDIRLRVTNGRPEIMVKTGNSGHVSRQEAGLPIVADTSLRQIMTALAIMGFSQGMAGLRVIRRHQVGEAEFALQEARLVAEPDKTHSYYLEVEIMTNRVGQATAEAAIRQIFADLNLVPLTPQETHAYIDTLNHKANQPFDYSHADWALINRAIKG